MTITTRSRPKFAPLVALAAGAILFACSTADQTTAPAPGSPSAQLTTGAAAPTPGVVTLCKVGADGAFSVQVGTGAAWSTVEMARNTCQTIVSIPPVQEDDVVVTITEQPRATYALNHIFLQRGGTADQTLTNTSTVSFEAAHGAIVTYYNDAVVNVCKEGTAATFQYQLGLGAPTQSLSLADGECKPIDTLPAAQQDDVIVTVRENASSSYQLDHINLLKGLHSQETITGQSSASFEGAHGAVITFHNVPVTAGCTYTQGYYKNRGASLLPSGNFYASGQTYLGVLETAPKGGNGYYILAHQYIAATLNAKNASVPPGILTAMAQSKGYFETAGVTPSAPYTATYTKDKLTGWADLLASYNEGQAGPGHCGNE
ncbi:MAG: hypothetical protein ACJ79A_07595 [Gemmatimonadaceae bacterium]